MTHESVSGRGIGRRAGPIGGTIRGTPKGVACPQQHPPARCALLSGRDRLVLSPFNPLTPIARTSKTARCLPKGGE
jgi:hypothetical protein